jgi:glycosyltransferase involved in cell wall biosynthesis
MQITTIIPTLCQAERSSQIRRAIESVKRASKDPVRIQLVVNGQHFATDLLAQLKARDDLEVIQIEEGSVVRARLVGRKDVQTPFFCFLDDDDEFLPGALDARLQALQGRPDADLVVTNGFAHTGPHKQLLYDKLASVDTSPLISLFEENWLADCNHLFRTASVGEAYFSNCPALMEWTWIAYCLASDGLSVVALDHPTFHYHDTPGSLSKSVQFQQSRVDLYHRMLATGPREEVADLIRRRLSSAWHEISGSHLGQGRRWQAFMAHLRSLSCHRSGLRYLSFTRHLVM